MTEDSDNAASRPYTKLGFYAASGAGALILAGLVYYAVTVRPPWPESGPIWVHIAAWSAVLAAVSVGGYRLAGVALGLCLAGLGAHVVLAIVGLVGATGYSTPMALYMIAGCISSFCWLVFLAAAVEARKVRRPR